MIDSNKERWLNWIGETLKSGSVSIPHGLIKFYKQLKLSEAETMLLIHLLAFRQHEGKSFPTVHELQERMAITDEDVIQHLRQLVTRKYIAIVEDVDENGMRASRYDFEPLYRKLAECYMQEMEQQLVQAEAERENGFVTKFEREFGRPLSPMECEILVKWLDEDRLPDDLIMAALKEAVFSGKLNFKYIDRILFEWKRNGIKTVEEARQHASRFRKKGALYQSSAQKRQEQEDGFPFYNWLQPQERQ